MAVPLLPLAGAGLSFVGNLFGNAQAKENAKTQAKMLYNNYQIGINNLKEIGEDLNREIGMKLTEVEFQELKAVGAMTNALTEREIVGNTARRLADNVNIKGTMYKNKLKQQAEATTVKIQREMLSKKYEYEAGVIQAAVNQANATKTGLQMFAEAGTSYYGAGGTDLFGTTV